MIETQPSLYELYIEGVYRKKRNSFCIGFEGEGGGANLYPQGV